MLKSKGNFPLSYLRLIKASNRNEFRSRLREYFIWKAVTIRRESQIQDLQVCQNHTEEGFSLQSRAKGAGSIFASKLGK